MRYFSALAVWTCILFVAATAYAGDWSETFAEESLPEQLVESRAVIATGGPGATVVGDELVAALERAGSPMAITNPVFDDIVGMSDRDVVAGVEHLPVDIVILIRTFGDDDPAEIEEIEEDDDPAEIEEDEETDDPDGADAEETDDPPATEPVAHMGMLTVYTLTGEAIAGFMVHPGQALTREQRRHVGRGISQDAVDATRSAVEGRQEGQYDNRYVLRGKSVYDHKSERIFEDASFYNALGYPHLSQEFRENLRRRNRVRTTSYLLIGAGGVATGFGSIYLAVDYIATSFGGDWSYVGPIIAGAGFSALLLGLLVNSGSSKMQIHPNHDYDFEERVEEMNELEKEEEDSDSNDEQSLQEQPRRRAEVAMAPYLGFEEGTQFGLALQIRW